MRWTQISLTGASHTPHAHTRTHTHTHRLRKPSIARFVAYNKNPDNNTHTYTHTAPCQVFQCAALAKIHRDGNQTNKQTNKNTHDTQETQETHGTGHSESSGRGSTRPYSPHTAQWGPSARLPEGALQAGQARGVVQGRNAPNGTNTALRRTAGPGQGGHSVGGARQTRGRIHSGGTAVHGATIGACTGACQSSRTYVSGRGFGRLKTFSGRHRVCEWKWSMHFELGF